MHGCFCSLCLVACLAAGAAAQTDISFERPNDLSGWRNAVTKEGRDPVIQIVADTAKVGEHSLMLAAQDPADVAVVQDLHVRPNTVYRIKAWVRTKDLRARDYTDVLGTVQIRGADNRLLAGAPASPGTTDWHEVQCVFRSSDEKTVQLLLYLVGFGKGTGTAWFDDVRVEALPETTITIGLSASKQTQCVLDFPIRWAKRGAYTNLMPTNAQQQPPGEWACGQVSHAMILRYWSMKVPLYVQGTYWYRRPQDGLIIRADYNAPISWKQMPDSLRHVAINDPRVNLVARFAFQFAVATRMHFAYQDSEGWHRGRSYPEAMTHFFGIDPAEYERISFGAYLATHTWADLYARINHDIDSKMPCELAVCGPDLWHEVVITGYRRTGDHYEYTIHFNADKYDPNNFLRIDQPMGGWTDLPSWEVSWGIKPYLDAKRVPLYNKIAELPGSIDWMETPAIAFSGQEYGILAPAGPVGKRDFLFHRQTIKGLPVGEAVGLPTMGHPMRPALIWADQNYAVAWADGADAAQGIYFARLDRDGRTLGKPSLVRPGADQSALAFCGDGYGLTFCTGRDVKFLRLDKDGRPLPNSEIQLGRRCAPAVSWTGTLYAVAWADRTAILLALIDKDGRMIGRTRRLDVPQSGLCEETQIAWSGSNYGLAWVKDVGNNHRLVCFCLADKDGNFLPETQFVVSDRPAKARDTTLGYAAGRYILTYRHWAGTYDGYASFLSKDGKLQETRCLFHSPGAVCHTIGDGRLNMICVRHYPEDGALETESCILNLFAGGSSAR